MKNKNTPSCDVDTYKLQVNLEDNLDDINIYAQNIIDAHSKLGDIANEVDELIECIEEWEDWASDAETEYENLIDEKDEEIKSLNDRVKELESENKNLINQVQKLEEKINNIED